MGQVFVRQQSGAGVGADREGDAPGVQLVLVFVLEPGAQAVRGDGREPAAQADISSLLLSIIFLQQFIKASL